MHAHRRLALVALALVLASGRTLAAESKLQIGVDPRVELLSAALTQSSYSAGLNGFFSPYAQDAQKTFFPHRTHDAVQRLSSLHDRGVGLRDLFRWIAGRGALPDLARSADPDPELAVRSGGADRLEGLAGALTALARDAGFDAFRSRHEPRYAELAASLHTRMGLPEEAIARLEAYTGVRRDSYRIIIAPLASHLTDAWTDSSGATATLLMSPDALRDGKLLFEPFTAANAIYLGFGSIAARDAVQSQPGRRDKHANWYSYLAERLRKYGIGDWSTTLTQLFAATVTARLYEAQGRTADARELARTVTARGMLWFPYTLSRMAEYENDRTRYPTLVAFAPRLYDALDELEPVFTGGEPGDLGLADVWLTEDGVPVKAVSPGSLGAQAGIRKGDTIQAIAGVRINGSESYLKAWDRWESAANGEAVPFKVKRGKSVLTLKVVMKRAGKFQGFRRKPTA